MARKVITEWLGDEHAAREIVILAASELVTNAVKYTDATRSIDDLGQITINLSHDATILRLAVTDPGSCSAPAHIPPQALDPYSERGRGLAIVKPCHAADGEATGCPSADTATCGAISTWIRPRHRSTNFSTPTRSRPPCPSRRRVDLPGVGEPSCAAIT
jgi:hypothetical protein